jgi:hypothetical protein
MLGIEDAPGREEIEAGIGAARSRTRSWKGRTGWAFLIFAADSGLVFSLTDQGPFHAQWSRFGTPAIPAWQGLLFLLCCVIAVRCGGERAAFYGIWRGRIDEKGAVAPHKASISHEEALVRELRGDPAFAAAYLAEAREDVENPGVLSIAQQLCMRAGLTGEKGQLL